MAKRGLELLTSVYRRRVSADPPATSDPVDDSPLLLQGGQDSAAAEARKALL